MHTVTAHGRRGNMVDIITAAMGAKMASGAVQSQIDQALTSVYKYKGQCTNAELANKTKTAGDVWEITDSGTFAQGTDVVCDGTNWNAMVGHLHVNVVDSLDSTSQQDALSANMGKALATGKQDKLTAGTGITISAENVISASGSSGTPTYTKYTDNINDLFDIESSGGVSVLTAKKNILMLCGGFRYVMFIPKGLSGYNFKISGGNSPKGSTPYTKMYIENYLLTYDSSATSIKLQLIKDVYTLGNGSFSWEKETSNASYTVFIAD